MLEPCYGRTSLTLNLIVPFLNSFLSVANLIFMAVIVVEYHFSYYVLILSFCFECNAKVYFFPKRKMTLLSQR